MSSEQNSVRETVPIKDRVNASTVTQIAGFYDEILEKESSRNPKLSIYELLKITASNLPPKIGDSVKEKALQAIAGEDEKVRFVGKRALQFLSSRTILTVVDSNFDKEKDSKEDREEMLMSAMISVIENASKINPKFQISGQVNSFAQMGIYSYFSKKNEIRLVVNRTSLKKEDTAFVKDDSFRNKRGLTNEGAENLIQDEDESFKNIDSRDRQKNLEASTREVLLRFLPEREREIVMKWFRFDGVKRSQEEIGEDYRITGAAVSRILIEAIDGLKHDPVSRKILQEYKDTI